MLTDLNEEQIEHVLQHEVLGHLGCHADNITYVVPICYAYDGKCIYGRTHSGMKTNMIRQNANVCFQVEHLDNLAKWRSVICWGEFEELTDEEKCNYALKVLQNRITVSLDLDMERSSYWPFSIPDLNHANGVMFCIHISKKTGKTPV